MKILGIHGMWSRDYLYDEFKKFFPGFEFVTVNVDWNIFNPELLAYQINASKSDIVIAYSFGAYAIQRVFESYPNQTKMVKRVVLLGPIGPKGMGWFTFLNLSLKNFKLLMSSLVKGVFDFPEKEAEELDLKFKRIPETRRAIMRAFPYPFAIPVRKPISVPALVVGGRDDVFVSAGDAQNIARFHSADLRLIDLGHFLLIDTVAEIIKEWLNCR